MVNEIVPSSPTANSLFKLEDVLNKQQVQYILTEWLKDHNNWVVSSAEIQSASDGLIGFLGEHLRMTLNVIVNGSTEKLRVFIKRIPIENKPKAEFIDSNGYFKREQLMFQFIEEMHAADGPDPWCAKILLNTKSLFVMHDVNFQGYSTCQPLESFDLAHTLVAATSIARYHADLTNYQARKRNNGNQYWTFLKHYGHIIFESNYKDSPWLRCAAKLTSNLIKTFSKKYNNLPELERKLTELFIEGCDSLKEYNNTLNVLIHKDLWANNIMFRYEKGAPCHALLVDFQSIRYGPPAFDLVSFIYYTTSRSFRERHEREILKHYYNVFSKHIENNAKRELKSLGYDEESFLSWCEKGRMSSLVLAIGTLPYALMDPKTAQKVFDDPETYDKYAVDDRTEPVIAHCYENEKYMSKQLEICEEFIERFGSCKDY